MGLRASHVYALATAIAFVLIALAGTLQAMRTTVAPSDGPALLLFAFEAVIIGGMGSFWGTFAGALILGVTQAIGFRFDPGWGIWFGHLVFLAVLVWRPQGLFPKTRRVMMDRAFHDLAAWQVERQTRASRVAAVARSRWWPWPRRCPSGPSRAGCASSSRSAATSSSRRCGTCWPAMAAWSRSASRRSSAWAAT